MRPTTRIPTHPGELLREETLPALGWSVEAVAEAIGVTRQFLYMILREERPVRADTALRLGRFLDTSPDLWMNLQANYDLAVARKSLARELAKIRPLGTMPRAVLDTGSGRVESRRPVKRSKAA